MLQLQFLRDNRQEAIERLKIKNVKDVEQRVDEILDLDNTRRQLQKECDDSKAEGNAIAKEIGMLYKQGRQDEAHAKKALTAELTTREKELSDRLAETDVFVYDLTGKLIYHTSQKGAEPMTWNLGDFAMRAGVYVYKVQIQVAGSKASSKQGKIIVTE